MSNSKLILPIVALLLAGGLAGCVSDQSTSSTHHATTSKKANNTAYYTGDLAHPRQLMSYKTALKKTEKVYKLSYFSNYTDTDDTDDAYYTIGYYKHNGEFTHQNVSSDDDVSIAEVVDPKATTPYLINDTANDTVYIHRPPYVQYNQAPVNGKVTSKTTK